MEKKKNVIILMTDQQRWDLRKSKGFPLDTMPFLDAWCEGGVDFCNAYTPNPTCMPARVSMFTGRYPSAHRVRTNHNEQDALYIKGMLEIFKENGYKTAICGKNHSHYSVEEFDSHETNGHLGHEDEVNHTSEEQDLADYLAGTKHMEMHQATPGEAEVQFPYRNVTSCLKFIDSLEENQPFFAWVTMAEPHNPYQVPEPYFDMFAPENLPDNIGTADDLKEKGERFVWLRKMWEKVLGEQIEERIARSRSNYLGMLRLIDDQFKRLIEGIQERRLEDDTIIIYLSDHGDFVGEYGLIRKGVDLPDVLTHIPMIWRGPGIEARGEEHQHFVNIVDILPTLCDLLGFETPFGCQGKSIRPLLENKNIPEKEFDTAYSESGFSGLYWNDRDGLSPVEEGTTKDYTTFDCLNTWTQCGEVRMLRKGDYKVQMDMLGHGYLYNLKEDPMELKNLWEVKEYQQIKADMLAELMAATLRVTDPIPAPHRRYRVKKHPKGYWFDENYIVAEDPGVMQSGLLHDYCEHNKK